VFQNPALTPDEVAGFYRSQYNEQNYGMDLPTLFRAISPQAACRIAWLTRQGVRLGPGVRALEIGAGCGAFLHALRDCGCEVSGIEPDGQACEFMRSRLGLKAYEGRLEDATIPEGQGFDLIALVHVLEHVAAVGPFMEKLLSLLKPEGLLFIEVPNALRPYTDEWNWFEFFDLGHVYSYSQSTLRRTLANHGVKALATEECRPLANYQALWMLATPSAPEPDLLGGKDVEFADDPNLVIRRMRYARAVHRWRWLRDRAQAHWVEKAERIRRVAFRDGDGRG
jgi:2-polyprenyl-3-methyl-5-hydroxy-6-metoxy-1,4-benzoquinol methylase